MKILPFPNDLQKTRKALKRYDKPLRVSRRERMLEDVINNQEEADAYFKFIKQEEDAVREAFAADTASINSHDNAMLVTIDTLRKWCKKIEDRKNK